MDQSPTTATTLLAILGRPAKAEPERVRRASDASRAVARILSQAAVDAEAEAALAEAAQWFAARLHDRSRAELDGALEYAREHARSALRALGPRAADAVLAQLSPAASVDELVGGVQLLDELTDEPAHAAALDPSFIPRLSTLLAVRREGKLFRALGTLLVRLAASSEDPDAARRRLLEAARMALDGKAADRREAAFHVLEQLGPDADTLADRVAESLAESPAAGLALGALSPDRSLPHIVVALDSEDANVVFAALRAVETAATHARAAAALALTDPCMRLLHDDRPRIGDQALLSLLVLGPPLRSLTVWSAVVAEREAAWLFSLPFRAAHLSDELFEALFGLAIDPETPKSVRLKIRGLFYVHARAKEPPAAATKYWKRLEVTPEV